MMMFLCPGRYRTILGGWWRRDPNGPDLPRPPPRGKTAGNDVIAWGEDLDSFFFTERIPGKNLGTVWSRTMIQEFGENYYNMLDLRKEEYEGDPYLLPVHPILTVGEYDPDEWEDCDSDYTTPATSEDEDGNKQSQDERQMHKKGGKGPAANANSPFGHLSKLEEFIPEEYFPDILLVHDADGLTPGVARDTKRGSSKPFDAPSIRYKRVWPTESSELFKEAKYDDNIIHPLPEAEKPRTAHLYLSAQCVIGKGNHSLVYRAALRPPPPLKAIGPFGQMTVAAKLAIPEQSARDMLKTEADIYNRFPRHLMEHWSGYNLIAPHKYPVPVHAVVPKFYGYYVPEEDTPASDVSGLSPILLIEECGEPIDPKELNLDEQSQCYTHILRLHLEEFIQNSVFTRNILIQPGPLDVAPHFRSREHLSFRIIDFGRCEQVDDWFKLRYGKHPSEIKCTDENDEEVRGMYRPWVLKKSFQEAVARKQLGVDLMDA